MQAQERDDDKIARPNPKRRVPKQKYRNYLDDMDEDDMAYIRSRKRLDEEE